MPDVSIVKNVADRICDNVENVIIGKRSEVQTTLLALLCEGHLLIEDVPGVGKKIAARLCVELESKVEAFAASSFRPEGEALDRFHSLSKRLVWPDAADLPGLSDGARVRVAGAVICRQRPGTAAGFLFLTLEDETGLVNVIVRPDLFHRERAVLVGEAVLEVDGVLQASEGLSVRAFAVRKALTGVPVTPARSLR